MADRKNKFSFQFPFCVQEAMTVAQSVASHVWAKHAYVGGEEREPSSSISLPTPQTLNLKTSHPEQEPEYHEKYGTAKVYFHFGGGMAVTVTMTSWLSAYGEHWAVNSVKARFYTIREGRGQDSEKTEMNWASEELDELAKLWGNRPYRWQD